MVFSGTVFWLKLGYACLCHILFTFYFSFFLPQNGQRKVSSVSGNALFWYALQTESSFQDTEEVGDGK